MKNKSQSWGFSSEDISRINAIDLSDPNSVAAINAINATSEDRNLMSELKEGIEYLALTRKVKELEEENKSLREGLSKVAKNIGNGACANPTCSVEFLTVDLPEEVRLVCEGYRNKIASLEARNKKLSKRHPTTEEALAQYHWLKENSKRNK